MDSRLKSRLTVAIVSGIVSIFASTCFPVWTLVVHDPFGDVEQKTPLWVVLWRVVILENWPTVVPASGDGRDIVLAGYIFATGSILGVCLYNLHALATRRKS